MKVRILQTVLIDGRGAMPGQIVEVPAKDAHSLIRRGLAEPVEGEPQEPDEIFLDTTAEEPEEKPKGRRK